MGRDGVEGWCSDWSNGDGQSCCKSTLTGVGCEGISCSGIGVEGWRPRARNTFIGSVSQRIRPSGALRRDGVEGWCSKWSNGDGQSCCIRTLTGVGCEGISCSGIGVEGWRPRARNTFIGSVCQGIRPSGALGRDGVEGWCNSRSNLNLNDGITGTHSRCYRVLYIVKSRTCCGWAEYA